MLSCPRCHTQFYQDIKICPQCGLSDPVVFCHVCHNTLDLRYANCLFCGSPINVADHSFQQPVNPQASAHQENHTQSTTQSCGNDVQAPEIEPDHGKGKTKEFGTGGSRKGVAGSVFSFIILVLIIIYVLQGGSSNTSSNISTISTSASPYRTDSGGYRTVDMDRDYSLPNAILDSNLTMVVKNGFSPYGYMSISEAVDWFETNGRSYEISKLSEKHDRYGRYILKVQYRISGNGEWIDKTGYMYTRQNKTHETYQGNISFFTPPDQNFLDAINWNQDKPYDADINGLYEYINNMKAFSETATQPPETASQPPQAGNSNAQLTEQAGQNAENQPSDSLVDYHVYNAYSDGTDVLGYFTFIYKGFGFDYNVSKQEDGQKIAECYCVKITDTDTHEFYGSFEYDWDTYKGSGMYIINNSSNAFSTGTYLQNDPSVLSIQIDADADHSFSGEQDFTLIYNANTNELVEVNDGGTTNLATIVWPTEFSYPPE